MDIECEHKTLTRKVIDRRVRFVQDKHEEFNHYRTSDPRHISAHRHSFVSVLLFDLAHAQFQWEYAQP
jgi:hypothetical protein